MTYEHQHVSPASAIGIPGWKSGRKGFYVELREKSYLMDKTSAATKKLIPRLMIILILFSAWTISE